MKDGGQSFFPIGAVKEATGLTERRIRYYETLELIAPKRTQGNQRLYSIQDIERLKEIKSLLDSGVSLRDVREHLKQLDASLHGTDEIERDAESYFQGKRLARGEPLNRGSLYPLRNRADIMRRLERDNDGSGKRS